MKKLILLCSILIMLLVYLNRSYSYFFDLIGEKKLQSPVQHKEYVLFNNNSLKTLKYAAIGDSLTAGVGSDRLEETYTYNIAARLSTDSTVYLLNLGYPSAKVQDLLPIIDETKDFEPDIITVFIGINDAFNRTPITEFRKNLDLLISGIQSEKTKIYLITIPYLGTNKSVFFPYSYLYDFQINRYNTVIKDLAKDKKLSVIDLYASVHKTFTTESDLYASDQFHPSGKGYILISEIISDAIINK